MNDAAEILRVARDVELASEKDWSPDGWGEDGTKCALHATESAAKRLGFGIGHYTDSAHPFRVAQYALGDAVPEWIIPQVCERAPAFVGLYNDEPHTTYADVIDLFDQAIKNLEDPA